MTIPGHLLLAVLAASAALPAHAIDYRVVFGSFRDQDNADGWATRLERTLALEIEVLPFEEGDGRWYRVASGAQGDGATADLMRRSRDLGLSVWRLDSAPPSVAAATRVAPAPGASAAIGGGAATVASAPRSRSAPARRPPSPPDEAPFAGEWDLDLGMQARSFVRSGSFGQSRFHPSLSARLEWHASWDDDAQQFTFTPFVRVDAEDEDRTHADLREMYWTRVGPSWDLHIGVRQVFWGVTEFHHLVDIVNQTDLVENIDGEDKLGQPMVNLSLLRDWGILDLYVLPGFRERTFPGPDGRLRTPLVVIDDASYASGAGRGRVDGALRWSHFVGPLSFAVHHFSGTSRDPELRVRVLPDGRWVLTPHYRTIDQTGMTAQAIVGDWAVKLEALSRSGDGDRYTALVTGFERTLVGLFGTRTDLGVVLEYMYDDRGDAAANTLFEHDVALGTRWRLNDLAGTQALLGVVWDYETDEYFVSLEASRRLGAFWTLNLEGRVFGGADALSDTMSPLGLLGAAKSSSLQRDDLIQLELTRYF